MTVVTREDKLAKRIHRLQSLMYVMGAGIVILFSVLVYGISQNQTAVSQSRAAICGAKRELRNKINSTEHFLETHPQGIPGIPNKLLRQGIAQDKAQLKALGPVPCS
jgi:hypothetical protein